MSLTIAPEVRIFFKEGKLLAGRLSMHKELVLIKIPDVVLINVLQTTTDRGALSDLVRARYVELGLKPVPARAFIQARSEFLTENGVLTTTRNSVHSKDAAGDCSREKVRNVEAKIDIPNSDRQSEPANGSIFSKLKQVIGGSSIPAKSKLRLSKNFMLIPTNAGFSIWSPVSRTYQMLSLESALILVAFAGGANRNTMREKFQGLSSSIDIDAIVRRLSKEGLIVSGERDSVNQKKRRKKATKKSAARAAGKSAWKALNLDGRTPIYFVTHMPDHYPLALGMLHSHISTYENGLLLKQYMPVPIVCMTAQELMDGPYKTYGQGVWLFSNYMWSIDTNLTSSSIVKNAHPQNITIHGGPSTPSYAAACEQFLDENKHVDIAVHGEGENAIIEILQSLRDGHYNVESLKAVSGLTIRAGSLPDQHIRTQGRLRMKYLDVIASPYLSGSFDQYGWQVDAAIIESNRGCPFSCTFCDWGSATAGKVRKFDLQRVKDEIQWIGKQRVRVLWVADANFGIYERDIELAEWICDVKRKYDFPREVVVNYTKNATVRLAKIVEIFAKNGICSQGIISIQTRDEDTLKVIKRTNIKRDKYNDLAEIFQVEGLPLSTDLMIGLPGITVEGFKQDLQYYFDKDVVVKAYPTQLLPNSPMADPAYIEKYKIRVDENDFLISTFSYSESDLKEMRRIYNFYALADSYAILRYVLRYLQWEHGVKALDFVHRLHREIENNQYPAISYVSRFFCSEMAMPGGWRQFYNEVADFSETVFGISRDDAFETVLRFNESVMPDEGITYPLKLQLDHDVEGYFQENIHKQTEEIRALSSYSPAIVMIEDKYSFASIDYTSVQYDTHQTFWELQSNITRSQSVPNFL